MTPEWYYIGHYGEIGPLTRDQLEELVDGGVIVPTTFVWRAGMTDWIAAERVPDLQGVLRKMTAFAPPPPPSTRPAAPPTFDTPRPYTPPMIAAPPHDMSQFSMVRSDKSRMAGGILQLVLPGIGRIYLGYAAIGVLQILLSLCGVGVIWAWIDGVIILSGGVRLDGYGRQLND